MAYCNNCGYKNSDNANFCLRCGHKIPKESLDSERKETYDGEIKKCPNCGEVLKSFTPNCPTCGYELRNSSTTNYILEFSRKLESASSEKQKDDLIRHFVMPNTKEDIYEFMILAATNLEKDGENTDAWYVKLEQAYNKAKIIMGNSSEFQSIEKIYQKAIRDYNKTSRSKKASSLGAFISKHWKGIIIALLFIFTIISFVLVAVNYNRGDYSSLICMLIGILLICAIVEIKDIKDKKNNKKGK